MKRNIETVIGHYPLNRKDQIRGMLNYLSEKAFIKFIYVAGAISFNRVDRKSDLDIHCVLINGTGKILWSILDEYFQDSSDLIYKTNEKHYPWFGEMRTYYTADSEIFSIDIGYIEENNVNEFYFQWNGIVIKDENSRLEELVRLSEKKEASKITKIYKFQLDQLLAASLKINKDIERRLYWNATENLMQLRRAFIFLYSYEYYYKEKYPFIGRPERDIEKIWSLRDLAILKKTISDGSLASIDTARRVIVKHAIRLSCLKKNRNLIDILSKTLNESSWA